MWISKLRPAVVTQAAPPFIFLSRHRQVVRPVCQSTDIKSVGLLVYRVRVGRDILITLN